MFEVRADEDHSPTVLGYENQDQQAVSADSGAAQWSRWNPVTPREVERYVKTILGIPYKPISHYIESNPKKFIKYKLKIKYGVARQYLCFDCNSAAEKWSYMLDDPGEFQTKEGTRFSLSPERYVPRCEHCIYQELATREPNLILKLNCEHYKHVPIMFRDRYEFKFCSKCSFYRRYRRKDYYAEAAKPPVLIGAQKFPELHTLV